MDGLARLHRQGLSVAGCVVPTSVSQGLCGEGVRGHCSHGVPKTEGSSSKLGPTQPLVKDDAQIAARGEWRRNRGVVPP